MSHPHRGQAFHAGPMTRTKVAAWARPPSDLDEKPASHVGTPKLREGRHLSQVTPLERGWAELNAGGAEPGSPRAFARLHVLVFRGRPGPLPFAKPLKVTRLQQHIGHRTSESAMSGSRGPGLPQTASLHPRSNPERLPAVQMGEPRCSGGGGGGLRQKPGAEAAGAQDGWARARPCLRTHNGRDQKELVCHRALRR